MTDLGTELFKQHEEKKKRYVHNTQGMGIKAGCVIPWWKNFPKRVAFVLMSAHSNKARGDGELQQNRWAWERNKLTLAKTEKVVAKK